jgi:phage/plasmid-associated DNA primase
MFTNNFFLDPSLDFSEIETITKSALLSPFIPQDGGKGVQGSRMKTVMKQKYGHELFFFPLSNSWYRWNGTFWKKLELVEMQKLLMAEIERIDPASQRASLFSDTLFLLSVDLARPVQDPPEGLINFKNGVYCTRTRMLSPHSPEYNFMYVIDCDYNAEAYPDHTLQSFLMSLVCEDRWALELLRGGIRRAIDPSIQLQTGFWIWGPPGTGKSSFIS